MVVKDGKIQKLRVVFVYFISLLYGLSIKLINFAKKSAKEPLKMGIIMQLRNGCWLKQHQYFKQKTDNSLRLAQTYYIGIGYYLRLREW